MLTEYEILAINTSKILDISTISFIAPLCGIMTPTGPSVGVGDMCIVCMGKGSGRGRGEGVIEIVPEPQGVQPLSILLLAVSQNKGDIITNTIQHILDGK